MVRRLPVYLLLDTSGSMMGEPIAAVENGVQSMVAALRGDPYALETAFLSVITFDSEVEQVIPLTELTDFSAPSLTAQGTTSLGQALSLLAASIKSDVRKNTEESKGDWKPLVFLMTDGSPTDDWKEGLADLKSVNTGMIVACAAGNSADTNILKQITEVVVELNTADSSTIAAFFQWISSSISTNSQKVETGGEISTGSDLPPPPPEVIVV